ncbi:MAG: 2Fe-2S iron-sulfur cluster-binding protein [Bacillota bacterium]
MVPINALYRQPESVFPASAAQQLDEQCGRTRQECRQHGRKLRHARRNDAERIGPYGCRHSHCAACSIRLPILPEVFYFRPDGRRRERLMTK